MRKQYPVAIVLAIAAFIEAAWAFGNAYGIPPIAVARWYYPAAIAFVDATFFLLFLLTTKDRKNLITVRGILALVVVVLIGQQYAHNMFVASQIVLSVLLMLFSFYYQPRLIFRFCVMSTVPIILLTVAVMNFSGKDEWIYQWRIDNFLSENQTRDLPGGMTIDLGSSSFRFVDPADNIEDAAEYIALHPQGCELSISSVSVTDLIGEDAPAEITEEWPLLRECAMRMEAGFEGSEEFTNARDTELKISGEDFIIRKLYYVADDSTENEAYPRYKFIRYRCYTLGREDFTRLHLFEFTAIPGNEQLFDRLVEKTLGNID